MKILSMASRFLGIGHYLHARGYGIMASLQCRAANMGNLSFCNLQNPVNRCSLFVCQFHRGPTGKSSPGIKSVHIGHRNVIFGPEYSTSVRTGRTYAADSRNFFHENGFSQTYWGSLRSSNFSSVSSQKPETKMPETKMPESKMTESKMPETKMPETKMTESKMPETKMPESKMTESKMPETKMTESKIPETKMPETKPSLWKRFKDMYREYWYVLVPVHILTSCVWFGSFYYLAVSGFDITALLEHWGVSEKIVEPLKSSGAGNIAVAYAIYKLATPARYTVTLGGTTVTINYLKKWGFIKPAPSASKLNQMIKDKGTKIQKNFQRKTR